MDIDNIFDYLSSLSKGKDTPKDTTEDVCCDKFESVSSKESYSVCINCGTVVSGELLTRDTSLNEFIDSQIDIGFDPVKNLYTSQLQTYISGNSRLAIVQQRSNNNYEKDACMKVYNIIKNLFGETLTENIIEEAGRLFKLYSSIPKDNGGKKIVRRDNRLAVIGVCIYYACKAKGLNRSHKEIIISLNINSKKFNEFSNDFLSHTYNRFDREINISHPDDFTDRFCNKLNIIDYKIICLIKKINNVIINLRLLFTSNAIGKSASCIYFVIQEMKLKSENISYLKRVSNISKVSIVSIKKNYMELITNKQSIFNYINENNIHV